MTALVRAGLAVLLPTALYFSTINLPLGDNSWLGFINNALWIANGLYLVIYLPLKGMGRTNWVLKVLVALLAISVLTTGFQVAVRDRAARLEALK